MGVPFKIAATCTNVKTNVALLCKHFERERALHAHSLPISTVLNSATIERATFLASFLEANSTQPSLKYFPVLPVSLRRFLRIPGSASQKSHKFCYAAHRQTDTENVKGLSHGGVPCTNAQALHVHYGVTLVRVRPCSMLLQSMSRVPQSQQFSPL
jgi:hypothetical protein